MPEDTIFRTRNTRKAYFLVYSFSALALLFVVYFSATGLLSSFSILAALLVIFAMINIVEIHRLGNLYELNPNSVVHTKGYISIESRRIDLGSISDVIITQTLMQRLLRFGDVHVRLFSIEAQATLKNIDKPHDFARLVENTMSGIRGGMGRQAQARESFGRPDDGPGTVEILG